jgi:GxxExxY protein
MLIDEELTEQIIGAAIEVHRILGPGLLERVYLRCFCRELTLRGIPCRHEVELPVSYKGEDVDCDFRIDVLVCEKIVVEIKSVEMLHPVHEAQLLTYIRLSGNRVGLLFNFGEVLLKNGMVRRVV